MKFPILSLGLLSLSAMSTLLVPSSAHAFCTSYDVPVQVAVTGSTDDIDQYSESQMVAEEGCYNSHTGNVGVQVYTGPGSVTQEQSSDHYVGGTYDPEAPEAIYVPESDPLFISVPVQVEAEVPPYDPAFQEYYGTLDHADGYN
ncbi:MAG: hypothetical protein WBD47_16130 [Phormidesmis sp.]